MTLHSTRKQSNFKLSLKKQILDNIGTIPVYFEVLDDIPQDSLGEKYTEWVVIQIADKGSEDLIEQFVLLHLFTYADNEGDVLSELQDNVIDVFSDTDGALIPFTLYDTVPDTWVSIGGVSVFEKNVSDELDIFKGVKTKTITLLCKWNAI